MVTSKYLISIFVLTNLLILQCLAAKQEPDAEGNCPEFSCGDGICVAFWNLCDDTNDCPDRKDESRCVRPVRERACTWFMYFTGRCVSQYTYCEEDREICDYGCIQKELMCDGKKDCLHGSDEKECECKWKNCTEGNRRCQPYRCDGVMDCDDGSDERGCQYCGMHGFLCQIGHCIPLVRHCDGVRHCGDGSDEKDCPNIRNDDVTDTKHRPTKTNVLLEIAEQSSPN